eukprot:gnl/TRDRNA2_/TRDRNA2_35120_c0_seq1.p1 gnl/TRDRNA2_/TRDRNA2_35120_c0~~gnl/TRDRNA2_/TRDRNA2_35120_c0_seq1.p1  ORF type:complete len:863 (-),score=130.72 gnl/TRDRNA2_/TRDRNA2_35120_c0_seq1:29-2617(-)
MGGCASAKWAKSSDEDIVGARPNSQLGASNRDGPALSTSSPQNDGSEAPPVEAEEPAPVLSIHGVVRALGAAGHVDAVQLAFLARWWRAILQDEPKEVLELALEGDGTALELAVNMPQRQALAAVPVLTALVSTPTPVQRTSRSSSMLRTPPAPQHPQSAPPASQRPPSPRLPPAPIPPSLQPVGPPAPRLPPPPALDPYRPGLPQLPALPSATPGADVDSVPTPSTTAGTEADSLPAREPSNAPPKAKAKVKSRPADLTILSEEPPRPQVSCPPSREATMVLPDAPPPQQLPNTDFGTNLPPSRWTTPQPSARKSARMSARQSFLANTIVEQAAQQLRQLAQDPSLSSASQQVVRHAHEQPESTGYATQPTASARETLEMHEADLPPSGWSTARPSARRTPKPSARMLDTLANTVVEQAALQLREVAQDASQPCEIVAQEDSMDSGRHVDSQPLESAHQVVQLHETDLPPSKWSTPRSSARRSPKCSARRYSQPTESGGDGLQLHSAPDAMNPQDSARAAWQPQASARSAASARSSARNSARSVTFAPDDVLVEVAPEGTGAILKEASAQNAGPEETAAPEEIQVQTPPRDLVHEKSFVDSPQIQNLPSVLPETSSAESRPEQPEAVDSGMQLASPGRQQALQQAAKELGVERVVVWLRLAGLKLPRGAPRPVDVGIRLVIPPDNHVTLRSLELLPSVAAVASVDAVTSALESLYVSEDTGWHVQEFGSSFTKAGPDLQFSATPTELPSVALGDELLHHTVPTALSATVKRLAHAEGTQVAVNAALKDGHVGIGLALKLAGEESFQSLAVDMAFGKRRTFDALHVERMRRVIAGVGATVVVAAIECRLNSPALAILRVTPT